MGKSVGWSRKRGAAVAALLLHPWSFALLCLGISTGSAVAEPANGPVVERILRIREGLHSGAAAGLCLSERGSGASSELSSWPNWDNWNNWGNWTNV